MLDRVRNNLGLKLAALAIAFAFWAYLRLTPNPVIAARFQQQVSVPIVTTGLGPDELVHLDDREALISVNVAPGGASVRPESVRAVLKLAGRGPGVYNVPVEVIAPKFEIKSLSPASVTIAIERIETRAFPVVATYLGRAPRGIVVSKLSLTPNAVRIRGATSDLEHVAGIRVDVPFPGSASTYDAMLRPIATGDAGSDVSHLSFAPNLVRVRAEFVRAASR